MTQLSDTCPACVAVETEPCHVEADGRDALRTHHECSGCGHRWFTSRDRASLVLTGAEAIAAEIADLRCADCLSEVIGPTGTAKRRYRVIHQETCPTWARYQRKLPGYTALPSGTVVLAGRPAPDGTTALVANSPSAPCGAVVTHRGPYQRTRAA